MFEFLILVWLLCIAFVLSGDYITVRVAVKGKKK